MRLSDAGLAMAAAEAGAAVVRSRFGATLDRVDKGGGDFATAADLESEAAILALLRAHRPGDAVIGEESGATGPADAGRTWLVDPLCGTLNFAAGTMQVAVNVALRVGGIVTAAAVADPFAGTVFTTGVDTGTAVFTTSTDTGTTGTGTGTGVFGAGTTGTGMTPSAAGALVDFNLDQPRPNAPAFLAARMLADPAFARFRPRVGSTSLALAWVATGQRAAYVTDGADLRHNVHFAAGIAICQAAGCVVTDLRGDPLGPSAAGLIAAADPDTHAALVTLAKAAGA